jgi:predicted MFS family arabinose efflux permease
LSAAARSEEAASTAAPPAPDGPPAESRGLTRGTVLLLAAVTGAAVANLYYVQPLLNVIGNDFGVSEGAAGLLVTCAQVGYVVGLALVVPIGDLVERRGLLTLALAASAVSLAACAAAPTFAILAVALLVTGVLSVVAQIIVPLASHLADPEERGRVVGTVMSGLLIGILLARTVSGLLAAIGGWRLVFGLAAALMLAMALLLRRRLQPVPPTERIAYGRALGSVLSLVRELPVLRQRMALGAIHFAGFSVLWTSLTFLLGGPHYGYSEGVIGLFGLAGVAGASVAPLAGHLADRGRGRLAQTVFLATILLSWGLLRLGESSLVPLLAGIVLIDAGIQGSQISNQAAIYALRPEARSRLTTAYMVSVFLGGTIGSALASAVYASGGWGASCALGAGLAALGLVIWAATQRLPVPGSA